MRVDADQNTDCNQTGLPLPLLSPVSPQSPLSILLLFLGALFKPPSPSANDIINKRTSVTTRLPSGGKMFTA